MSVTSIITDAIIGALRAVYDALIRPIFEGIAESIEYVLYYEMESIKGSPFYESILALAVLIAAACMLYYPLKAIHQGWNVIKLELINNIKERWMGLITVFMGLELYAIGNEFWTGLAQFTLSLIGIDLWLIFSMVLGYGIIALLCIPLILIGTMSMVVYVFVLIGGSTLIVPVGVLLFFFPSSEELIKLVRLLLVNQAYPFVLALILLVTYMVSELSAPTAIMVALMGPVISAIMCITLIVMYLYAFKTLGTARDLALSKLKSRYNKQKTP